jgi:hypothetical protein
MPRRRSVARGNCNNVSRHRPHGVRDLAANFSRMTEEVRRSQQTLRDFLANISRTKDAADVNPRI